jgi:hypothetical protein
MKTFADLLDDYLFSRDELRKARDGYDGYSFSYFHFREIEKEEKARNALNEAFEKVRNKE